jgi:soluble lytic murein transglycosylase-like protein
MRGALLRTLRIAIVGLLVAGCTNAGATGAEILTPTPAPTASATPTAAPATPSASPTPSPTPNYKEVPVAANDPDGVTKQLSEVDAALRDPKTDAVKLAYMGHLQQLAISRLVDYPEWQPGVLAALPEKARAVVQGSLDASKQLHLITGPIPKTLPDWKIQEVAPIDELMSYYKEAEAQFGVPWYDLASIHLVESRMGRIHGLSSAGAQGPMQFMPATWSSYGKGDVNSDHDSIIAAARYLVAAGAPGDMQRAFYAYNHSLGYVNALLAYASVMKNDPAQYAGYHGWQVYYATVDGPVFLPVGWTKP